MRIAALLFISLFLFSCPSFAQEKEELAPGYNACMKNIESFEDETRCAEKAHMYQSGRLEEVYKKTRNLCNQQKRLQ